MNLELETSNEITINEPKVVATTKAQISTVTVDFNSHFLAVLVHFGSGDPFVSQKQEMWLITGDLFLKLLSREVVGSTFAETSAEGLLFLISYIQDTPNLKETCLANGTLQITGGSLLDFIKIR